MKPRMTIVSGMATSTMIVPASSGFSASVAAPAAPIFDWAQAVARAATLSTAAALKRAWGDPLGALNLGALREDPPALALRGIALTLGRHQASQRSLRVRDAKAAVEVKVDRAERRPGAAFAKQVIDRLDHAAR